jgi:AcrR family transcriptional regulator
MAYHHGDLRRALLQAADEAITEQGVAALSMRDLARRAGVSHAAPTHHFGDKAGLLTAFAASGFEQLARALATSRLASNSFIELGVTYIRFATTKRALFEVMFRTDLYHADDPSLLAARAQAADALYAAVSDLPGGLLAQDASDGPARPVRPGTAEAAPPEVRRAGLAAWSMAHGFATLWLTGAFPDRDLDPAEMARTLFAELSRDFAP